MTEQLSKEGKQQVALALILLKDFKCEGRFDPEITILILKLADTLGVMNEYDGLLSKVPPMKITPRN
jgi:hypothetical protein